MSPPSAPAVTKLPSGSRVAAYAAWFSPVAATNPLLTACPPLNAGSMTGSGGAIVTSNPLAAAAFTAPPASATWPASTVTVYAPASAASQTLPGAATVYVAVNTLPAPATVTPVTGSGPPGPVTVMSATSIVPSFNASSSTYVTTTACVGAPDVPMSSGGEIVATGGWFTGGDGGGTFGGGDGGTVGGTAGGDAAATFTSNPADLAAIPCPAESVTAPAASAIWYAPLSAASQDPPAAVNRYVASTTRPSDFAS